jgi:hypothetical protein
MAANKEKIARGVNLMAFSFPFILFGPSLYFWKGANGWQNGQWWWGVISIALMALAVFLAVKGLRLILAGLFGDK